MKKFFKNEFVKMLLIGIIINSLCFIFGTCYAKASSTQGALPYYVTYGLNYPFQTYIDIYNNNAWGTMYPVDWTRSEILAYSIDDGSVTNTYFFVPIDVNATYEVNLRNIPYLDFDYTTQYLEITFVGLRQDKWYCLNYKEYQDGTVEIYGFQNTDTVRFFGSGSFSYPKFLNGGTYFQTNLNGVQDNPVLISNYNSGEPIPPEWDDNLPNKPTQPNTPTPPTMPTINDISDLGNWLLSLFSWLIGVVTNWFSYISNLLEWLFTKLGNTIKQGFESIYNNFKNFLQPIFNQITELIQGIKEKIEYIAQPVSASIIYDNIENSSFLTSINSCKQSIETFKSVFNDTSEPQTYTIAIHLENLNGGILGSNLTTQYFDLSVINPVKSSLRTFMWCLITFGLFITIIDSISNYINGGQDE